MRYGISTKLLVAMLVAVILPLGMSAVLLIAAVDTAYVTGINRRVHEALERTPIAYRALFDALKSDFEHSTEGIVTSAAFCELAEVQDAEAIEELLGFHVAEREDLIGLALTDEFGTAIASVRHEPDDLGQEYRPWSEELEVAWGQDMAIVTARWIAPQRYFDSFQSAGQVLELYGTFEQGRFQLRNIYVGIYLGMVGVVLIVAVGLGFFLSRRVTTRVARLCDATRQVAGGDLTTRVPVGPLDEVGDLAATFNVMVERLLESRERIEYLQRVAAWQQLARRLAHEIKNPLTPIQLAVQELRDRYKGDDESFKRVLNQATEIVVEEVEVLRRLTGEFSAFAKLPDVNTTPIELHGFLADVAQTLEILPTEHGSITVEIPEEGITVNIDRMLMKRVLDNLVRNALEAIDGSGVDGQVVVRGGCDASGSPFIVVEDSGPGIAREEQQRVFEPYYTTKETGTGLGLAIVKKIVLEHNGVVTLTARKDRGMRFMIRFQT